MDKIDGEGRWDSGRLGQKWFDYKHLKPCRRKWDHAGIISCCIRALMRAQRSPGVKIVISRNRWDNFGGNLNGEVGLQERFSKSRLDFHQPPKEKKWGCLGYISGYLMDLIGTTGPQSIWSMNLRDKWNRHRRGGGNAREIWPAHHQLQKVILILT